MRGLAVQVVNPPSPPGSLINREGMGGLGVVTDAGGFVYPALFLAEMQASLKALGAEVSAADLTLQPQRSVNRAAQVLIVRVALASLRHDVEWALKSVPTAADLILIGTGLARHAATLTPQRSGLRVLEAAHGHEAAAMLAGVAAAEEELLPDADWEGLSLGSREWLPMHHQRGCELSCRWCPYVLATGRRILARSAARTAAEFAAQVQRHHPRRVVFRDPVFAARATDALMLLSRLAALPVRQRAPFEIETRPEFVTRELAMQLVRAGCAEVKLGVDTLEPQVLADQSRLKPGETAADYRESVRTALRVLDDAGLPVRCFVLQGLPGATARGEAELLASLSAREGVSLKRFEDPARLLAQPR